ncbi:MAG TPA: hypothetical protein VGW76_16250 [Pyrinomonadaceae bacterium]|nr:hypothetical protein [Pyrinomonadaceae bacterium]
MTIKDVEHIEDCAYRGLPIDRELILTLTGYLRNTLQVKANAEALAHEAAKRAGIKSSQGRETGSYLAWTLLRLSRL